MHDKTSPCLADEFRFGRWQATHHLSREHRAIVAEREASIGRALGCEGINIAVNRSLPRTGRLRAAFELSAMRCAARAARVCTQFEYVNATCGAPFSMRQLCDSLRCRGLLLVGDSTMGVLFLSLMLLGVDARYQFPPDLASCPSDGSSAIRETITICAGHTTQCPRGVNVSYWRHDHLHLGAGHEPHALARFAHNGSNCDGWASWLGDSTVGVLSRGAHLNEYPDALKASADFHIARADELAGLLRGKTVVYLRAHWGHAQPVVHPGRPLDDAPPPASNYSWALIPMINEVTAARLRARLYPRSLVLIDPTRAISMRADCRNDALHLNPEVHLSSTWRMLQSALAWLR